MSTIGEGSPNTIKNKYDVRQQIPSKITLKNSAFISNEFKAKVRR
jgi:hypothetical protein